jgi:uncharacterized protein (UPF0276 family)
MQRTTWEQAARHITLRQIRKDYPLSLHGVALSIGGAAPLDLAHLERLKRLIERYEPILFSEHLAWSTHEGVYLDDLLPVPYTNETLQRVCEHIDAAQETLGVRMLLENPSTYVQFKESSMSEVAFIAEVARRTGCGLLLDVNNVFVSCTNHRMDPRSYLAAFPMHCVGEMHLAGHDERLDDAGAPLLVDAHGSPIIDPVWTLFEAAVAPAGPVPTLIERDANIPHLSELMSEAQCARDILRRHARPNVAA